ncbi:MAG: rRNA maturation RNase YbeY [Acidobacteria bacterium]|nr:rRNA maturation RNase YbeY [Acidobacteriota bacterium]
MIVTEKKIGGVVPADLERFAERARRAAGLSGEVNILITSDAELRRLNRAFRHKNKATDVLSFPATSSGIAGDIAISADTAARSARFLAHSLADELKVLIVHGMLHLAGHDHESDNGEMARKETRLRGKLGLPQGLIQRTVSGQANVPGPQRARKTVPRRRTPV